MTRRKVYGSQWRGKLWGHSIPAPSSWTRFWWDAHYTSHQCQQVTKPNIKKYNKTTTLCISLIQRRVYGFNARPWKRSTLRISSVINIVQTRKIFKPYFNWSRSYRDNDEQVWQRLYRYPGQIPKRRILRIAPTTVIEILPFCYLIATIAKFKQKERKEKMGRLSRDYQQKNISNLTHVDASKI